MEPRPRAGRDIAKTATEPIGIRARQRVESRRRLLDATFACLLEFGYAGTTTVAITRKAGLSNGALFNHFAAKDDLIVAAVLELLPDANRAIANEEVIDAVRASPRPVAAAVDLVWLGMFAPVAVASAELYNAARTSPTIATALAEVEPDARAGFEALTVQIFPELEGWEGLSALVTLVRSYVLGAATALHALGDHPRFEASRRMLVDALEPIIHAAIQQAGRRTDEP